jgi:hypothetical protein
MSAHPVEPFHISGINLNESTFQFKEPTYVELPKDIKIVYGFVNSHRNPYNLPNVPNCIGSNFPVKFNNYDDLKVEIDKILDLWKEEGLCYEYNTSKKWRCSFLSTSFLEYGNFTINVYYNHFTEKIIIELDGCTSKFLNNLFNDFRKDLCHEEHHFPYEDMIFEMDSEFDDNQETDTDNQITISNDNLHDYMMSSVRSYLGCERLRKDGIVMILSMLKNPIYHKGLRQFVPFLVSYIVNKKDLSWTFVLSIYTLCEIFNRMPECFTSFPRKEEMLTSLSYYTNQENLKTIVKETGNIFNSVDMQISRIIVKCGELVDILKKN